MTRWPISRIALLVLFAASTATAGGFSLFGKKKKVSEAEPAGTPPEAPAAPPPTVPEAPPLFPEGVPVSLDAVPEGLASLSAQACAACHVQIHDDWSGSGHQDAWRDSDFQTAMGAVGDSTACTGCHLPLTNQHPRLAIGYNAGDLARPDLQPNTQWDPTLMTEGVTCAACHIRDGKVLSTRVVEAAPHAMAVSSELASSASCATCHQLTWPEADQPFYDTYGEWERSPYAEAGVRCQDCHMPPTAGVAVASRYATQAGHGFAADTGRGVSVLVEVDHPEVVRGEAFAVRVRIQNTGAGHSFPTGSPFKATVVKARLLGTQGRDQGKDLADAGLLTLQRAIEPAPPWKTLSDNRIAPGQEAVLEHSFTVSQRTQAQDLLLEISVETRVGAVTKANTVLQEIPIPLL